MGSIDRLAGAAGSTGITTKTTAGQLITPVSAPVVRWYTDQARTLNEVTLAVTGSGSSYTATWTAAQAPAAAAKRYLKITMEVSAGVFDVDADDEVSFVDATAVVGNAYLSVADIRALPNIGDDKTRFPDARIEGAIAWFEETFEDYTQVAWVPRTRTVTLEPYRDGSLQLPDYHPRSITSIRVYTTATTYTDFTAGDLAGLVLRASGKLTRWGAYFTPGTRVTVTYEYGETKPPSDVLDACKVAVRAKLHADKDGREPYLVATEGLVQRFSRPGPGHPFGLDEVDEVANRRAMVSDGGSVVVG